MRSCLQGSLWVVDRRPAMEQRVVLFTCILIISRAEEWRRCPSLHHSFPQHEVLQGLDIKSDMQHKLLHQKPGVAQ